MSRKMHMNSQNCMSIQAGQGTMTLLLVLVLTISVSCEEVFVNNFAVHIEGGVHVANRVARETGFKNLGQVSCDFFS